MPYDDEPAEAASLLEELELLRMKLDAISRTNESLTSEKQVLASEKAEWMEERKALVARIHYMTALLSGQTSTKAQPELLKVPVDAGVTA